MISRLDDGAPQCILDARVVSEALTRDETLAAIRAAERARWDISALTRVPSPAPMGA